MNYNVIKVKVYTFYSVGFMELTFTADLSYFQVYNHDTDKRVFTSVLTSREKHDFYKAYNDPSYLMYVTYGWMCINNNTLFIKFEEENGGWFPAQSYKVPLTEDNVNIIKSFKSSEA
jgi:hypothetical protein